MKLIMNLLFFVVVFFTARASHSAGPLFQHKDTYVNQEFENAYRDIGGLISSKVLQTVVFSTNTAFTTTSNTFGSTNLSATIIPRKTNSTIFVFVSVGEMKPGTDRIVSTVFRDSTDIVDSASGNGFGRIIASGSFVPFCQFVSNTPSTSVSTTYTLKIHNNDNATSVGSGGFQTMILVEVTPL